jgi:sphingolipid delta-4 desaturase
MIETQVAKLMGHEPLTKWVVLGVVSLQVTVAYYLRNTSMMSPTFLILAYVVGGTANQNLFLAIHEITHNLAFKGIKPNKALAMFANLPIGIPYCSAFKVSFGQISRNLF